MNAFCILAFLVERQGAYQQKLDDLLAASIKGSADSKAEAYKSLFQQVTPFDLNKLTASPDLSLALQAKFELLCIPPKLQKGDLLVPGQNFAFENFFTQRVGFAPPTWWAKNFRVAPGPQFGEALGLSGWKSRPVLPSEVWRKEAGDEVTIGDSSHQITLPRSSANGTLYVIFLGDRAYIETYDPVAAYPSTLSAYQISDGRRLWQRQLWGNYQGGFAGQGVHALTMEIHKGLVVVYGGGPGSYAQGFDLSSGEPVFRFSTNYWFGHPEEWDLPWRKIPMNSQILPSGQDR